MTRSEAAENRSRRQAEAHPDQHPPPHVGIIGAGLSGLRCADVLLQHGFHVTVIEARDRLGGRVHQQEIPTGLSDPDEGHQPSTPAPPRGPLVDLGPNWIHGSEDNPLYDLAVRTNTVLCHTGSECNVTGPGGEPLARSYTEPLLDLLWAVIQEAFEYATSHTKTISPDRSLFDFIREHVRRRIPDTEPGYEKSRQTMLQLSEFWNDCVGMSIRKQSLKFFWMEECIARDNLFCAGTYQNILREVARSAVAGAVIKYTTLATTIRTLSPTETRDQVLVETDKGEVLKFDHVVVTAPLGWLKSHLDAFQPGLPPRIVHAINSLGFGTLEKAYISFPKPFWLRPEPDGPGAESCSYQWLEPGYDPAMNPKKWYQEAFEFGSLPEAVAHPTLLFYLHGDLSTSLTDATAAMPARDRQRHLAEFFRPYFSRLPGFCPTSPDCRPTGCLLTDWSHDELAGNGSYTNFPVGLEAGDDHVRALREGAPEAGLWFAGEHTAPFVAMGTATGAYWSGESVARRIAEAYGKGTTHGGEDEMADCAEL